MLQNMKNSMKNNGGQNITVNLFVRIMLAQMAMALVPAVNSIVDSIIAGRYLTEMEISVIRLQIVADTFVSIVYIFTEGGRILICEMMGRGKRKEMSTLISTTTILVTCICTALTLVFTVFATPIAKILGARGECIGLCVDYVSSCALGIVPRILSNLFYCLCLMYGISGVNHIASILGILVNATMDILLTGKLGLGLKGLGLATSLGYWVVLFVLLIVFFAKISNKLERGKIWDGSAIREIIKNGTPIFCLTFGMFVGNYLVNQVILSTGGTPATAAGTVQRLFFLAATIIAAGCGNAYIIVANVLYAMQDKEGFVKLTKTALKYSVILSFILAAFTIIFRQNIVEIYFTTSDKAWSISMKMLLIIPFQGVLLCIYMIFYKLYQVEKRYRFVTCMALFEESTIALFAFPLGKFFSIDGVWAAHIISGIVWILIIWIYSSIENKKPCLSLKEMFLLEKSFPEEKNIFSLNIKSMDDVLRISGNISDFLKGQGYSKRISLHTSLCLEEMAGNIVRHGFEKNGHNSIDINISSRERQLLIFLRDDCRIFDPTERVSSTEPADIFENVGIRLISNIATEMKYINTLGANTLIIQLTDD